MKQISAGVYTLSNMGMGRVYLIVDPDGLTLIDTALASSPPQIIAQIRALGREPQDVKRILITHAHPDHIGGLPALQRATGARVIAPAGEKAVIEGAAPALRPARDQLSGIWRLLSFPSRAMPGAPVDQVVSDEDTFSDVLGGLVAVSSPGHSPDHMAYWQPERRILFCGDVLMNLAGLTLPFAAFTVDMEQDKRSISRLSALEPEIVCFGHGQPLVKNASASLRTFADKVLPASR